MSDSPVPETLETIAAKIDALSKSNDERFGNIDRRFDKIDQRFDRVDQRFGDIDQRLARNDRRFARNDERFATIDEQFAETRAQLGIKIEAVETKVVQVYDAVIAMREDEKRNAADHKSFAKRLDAHHVRLLALETPRPPEP